MCNAVCDGTEAADELGVDLADEYIPADTAPDSVLQPHTTQTKRTRAYNDKPDHITVEVGR